MVDLVVKIVIVRVFIDVDGINYWFFYSVLWIVIDLKENGLICLL